MPQHNGAPEPIPTAGAADLGALKGGNKSKQRRAAKGLLIDKGYICPCGELIARPSEKVTVVGIILGRFPSQRMTPLGPVQQLEDGAVLAAATYHGRACPMYLSALSAGIPVEQGLTPPEVMAVMFTMDGETHIEWLKPPAFAKDSLEADH